VWGFSFFESHAWMGGERVLGIKERALGVLMPYCWVLFFF
jgi:hypothetical protein